MTTWDPNIIGGVILLSWFVFVPLSRLRYRHQTERLFESADTSGVRVDDIRRVIDAVNAHQERVTLSVDRVAKLVLDGHEVIVVAGQASTVGTTPRSRPRLVHGPTVYAITVADALQRFDKGRRLFRFAASDGAHDVYWIPRIGRLLRRIERHD